MYGQTMGDLIVYEVSSAGQLNTLWERSGDAGNAWHRASIQIVNSDNFQV